MKNIKKRLKKRLISSLGACIIALVIRGVAQVVERYFREVEAASSSLVTPMKKPAMFIAGFLYIREEYG